LRWKQKILPLLLLAASLSACGERASVALADVDASPSAIAREQYRYLHKRSDEVAAKLNGAEPAWPALSRRYEEWAARLAKAAALPRPASAHTVLSYRNLDSDLDWIERQADTYAQYVAMRRAVDYPAMRKLAVRFAAADQQAARQLMAGSSGDGEFERTTMHEVLVLAHKLREGMRGLDSIRAARDALAKLQPDGQEEQMMASVIRRAQRSVQALYGLDGEDTAFEALRAFAAADVRFIVDDASCSKLEGRGVAKGWYLGVRAFDANDDEIDYVVLGMNGHASVGPYFYLAAPKAACEQIASRVKGKVLASKPAGTFGMRYQDKLPRFDLVGTY